MTEAEYAVINIGGRGILNVRIIGTALLKCRKAEVVIFVAFIFEHNAFHTVIKNADAGGGGRGDPYLTTGYRICDRRCRLSCIGVACKCSDTDGFAAVYVSGETEVIFSAELTLEFVDP